LTNYLPVAENGPIDVFENRPSEQLDHGNGRRRRILNKELEELAKKKYRTNGKGITFEDVIENFHCSQTKAQRKLKNACIEHSKPGKKSSVLFRLDNERTIPQQFFPSSIKATIIENQRNRLIDPTGVSYNNKTSHHPLHNAIENQIVQSFLLQLYLLPWQPLNMHNIHLWTIINKSHYEEIKLKPCSDKNKTKIQRELISLREVVYKFNKNGSIEIEIACSKNPFPLETSYDVFNFFVFLGEVKYTLANILHDPRDRIVPSVDNWILKYCDFNKDIELDDKNIGQFMDLNIQIKYAGEAFRLYVKNLEDRFVLRGEKVMKVNQPVTTFLNDAILNPYHLIENKFTQLYDIIGKNYLDLKDRIEDKK
jgi:hypothetical protein